MKSNIFNSRNFVRTIIYFFCVLFSPVLFSKPLVDAASFLKTAGFNRGQNLVILTRAFPLSIRELTANGHAVVLSEKSLSVERIYNNGFNVGVTGFFTSPVAFDDSCFMSDDKKLVKCAVERVKIFYRTVPIRFMGKIVFINEFKDYVFSKSGISSRSDFDSAWSDFLAYFNKTLSSGKIVELPGLGYFEFLTSGDKDFDFVFSEDIGIPPVDGVATRSTRQTSMQRCVTYSGIESDKFTCSGDVCRIMDGFPGAGQECFDIDGICEFPLGTTVNCSTAVFIKFTIKGTDKGQYGYAPMSFTSSISDSKCDEVKHECVLTVNISDSRLNGAYFFSALPNNGNVAVWGDDCISLSDSSKLPSYVGVRTLAYVPISAFESDASCSLTFQEIGVPFSLQVIGSASATFTGEEVSFGEKIVSCTPTLYACSASYVIGSSFSISLSSSASSYSILWYGDDCPVSGSTSSNVTVSVSFATLKPYSCHVVSFSKAYLAIVVLIDGPGTVKVSGGKILGGVSSITCHSPYCLVLFDPSSVGRTVSLVDELFDDYTSEWPFQSSCPDPSSVVLSTSVTVCSVKFYLLNVSVVVNVSGKGVVVSSSPIDGILDCGSGRSDSKCSASFTRTIKKISLTATLDGSSSLIWVGPDCSSKTNVAEITFKPTQSNYSCSVFSFANATYPTSCPSLDYLCGTNKLCNGNVSYRNYYECCKREFIKEIVYDIDNTKPPGKRCESPVRNDGEPACFPHNFYCEDVKCAVFESQGVLEESSVSCIRDNELLLDCADDKDGIFQKGSKYTNCMDILRTKPADYVFDAQLFDFYKKKSTPIYGGKTMCYDERSNNVETIKPSAPCGVLRHQCVYKTGSLDCKPTVSYFVPGGTFEDYVVPIDKYGTEYQFPSDYSIGGCKIKDGYFMECVATNRMDGVRGLSILSTRWVYSCPFFLRFKNEQGERHYQVKPRGFDYTYKVPTTDGKFEEKVDLLSEVDPYFSDYALRGENRLTCSANTTPPCKVKAFSYNYTLEYAGSDGVYCGISGGENDGQPLGLNTSKCAPIWVGGCSGGVLLDICNPELDFSKKDEIVLSFGNETCGAVSFDAGAAYIAEIAAGSSLLSSLGLDVFSGALGGYPGVNYGYAGDEINEHKIEEGDYHGGTLYFNTYNYELGTQDEFKGNLIKYADAFAVYNATSFEDCTIPELIEDTVATIPPQP